MGDFHIRAGFITNYSEDFVPGDPVGQESGDLDPSDSDDNLVIDMKPRQTEENGHADMNLPPELEIKASEVSRYHLSNARTCLAKRKCLFYKIIE